MNKTKGYLVDRVYTSPKGTQYNLRQKAVYIRLSLEQQSDIMPLRVGLYEKKYSLFEIGVLQKLIDDDFFKLNISVLSVSIRPLYSYPRDQVCGIEVYVEPPLNNQNMSWTVIDEMIDAIARNPSMILHNNSIINKLCEKDSYMVKYGRSITQDMYMDAVSKNIDLLNTPNKYLTQDTCDKIMYKYPDIIHKIPKEFITLDMCICMFLTNRHSYIPKTYHCRVVKELYERMNAKKYGSLQKICLQGIIGYGIQRLGRFPRTGTTFHIYSPDIFQIMMNIFIPKIQNQNKQEYKLYKNIAGTDIKYISICRPQISQDIECDICKYIRGTSFTKDIQKYVKPSTKMSYKKNEHNFMSKKFAMNAKRNTRRMKHDKRQFWQ